MSIDRLTPWGNTSLDPYNLAPISDAQKQRAKRIRHMWNYYKGFHRKPLIVKSGQADDNVILNDSRRVVDKGVAFLFGVAPDFEIDSSTEERSPEEAYLDACWGTPEQKQRLLIDLALNGFVAGTGCVRLYEPLAQGDLPRMVVMDASMLDIVTMEDDIEDIRCYLLTWKVKDGWKRHRIDRQMDGTWVVAEETHGPNDGWRLTQETVWPWQFAPVFACQNLPDPNTVWGMSDLEEADINDAINFTASNINRILRFHSHPKTIGSGFSARQLENTAIDQFWSIDNENAKVYNLEMQSDLASAYQMLRALKDTYAKVTGVPNFDPDNMNVGQLSGFAMRILYSDLLDKTDVKRVTYGALLADLNSALIEMAGMGADVKVRNVWHSPLPQNDKEEAEILEIDRRNGLSMQTFLDRRGYDYRREQERRQNERDEEQTIGERMLRRFELGEIAQAREGNDAAPST